MLEFPVISDPEYEALSATIMFVIWPVVSSFGNAAPENTTVLGLKLEAPIRFFPLKSKVPEREFPVLISIAPPTTVPVFVMMLGTART